MVFDPKKVPDILQAIRNETGAAEYFFRNVESPEWFDVFEKEGYFKPENNPAPKQNGTKISFSQWQVLPFLEKLSNSIQENPNKELIWKIKKIIKEVSLYRNEFGEPIENYFTWWSFSRMLVKLPNEAITEDLIELIPTYINTKFDNTPQATEILEKLLPKFLNDSPTKLDIKKAEMIFNYVTVFLWKKDEFRSSLSDFDKNEAFSLVDPFWLSDALLVKQQAIKIGRFCSENVIRDFSKRFQHLLLMENLPLRRIREEGDGKNLFAFISYIDKEHLELEVSVHKRSNVVQGESEYELIESFEKISVLVHQGVDSFVGGALGLLKLKSVSEDVLKSFMKEIYSSVYYDFSGVYLRKVNESYLREASDIKSVFSKILIHLLKGKFSVDKEMVFALLSELKGLNFPLFKRIILYHTSENWSECADFFWSDFSEAELRVFFDDSNCKMELKELLEKNFKSFDQSQKELIKKVIDAGPILYSPKENKERYENLWKVRWYSVVKEDELFRERYLVLKDLTTVSGDEYFDDSTGFEYHDNKAPLEMAELLSLSNEEVVNYFKGFKSETFRPDKPNSAGLVDLFKKSVEEQPEKYFDNLEPFNSAPYFYVSNLLEGFHGALKNKKILDWQEIISYFKTYISAEEFWTDKYICDDNHWGSNHKWVIGSYGRLLQEGLKDDVGGPIPAKVYYLVKETIFSIFQKLNDDVIEEQPDQLGYVLNSPRGKVLTAYLDLYRKEYNEKHLANSLGSTEWKNEYRSALDGLLNDGSIEAYTLFGEYILNLFVIDRDWLKEKVAWVLKQDEQKWLFFLEGYLFKKTVYREIFELLKPSLEKALSMKTFKESTIKNVVDQIAVAHIYSFDSVLYQKILKDWDTRQLLLLINYYYSERREDKESKRKDAATQLFKTIYERYKDGESLTDEDERILSEVAKLIIYFDSLEDEKGDFLILSSKHIKDGHVLYWILDELDRLKDKGVNTRKVVAEALLNLTDVIHLTFKHDVVKKMVEYFYETKDQVLKDLSNQICRKCMKNGYSFLDDVYFSNNN